MTNHVDETPQYTPDFEAHWKSGQCIQKIAKRAAWRAWQEKDKELNALRAKIEVLANYYDSHIMPHSVVAADLRRLKETTDG